jgi:hypothetical protein
MVKGEGGVENIGAIIFNIYAIAPTTYQALAAVLIQAADLYCARVGDAAVEPALNTVVVPGVAALIVQVPTPIFNTVITVPTAKLYVASVGNLNAIAVALFICTNC